MCLRIPSRWLKTWDKEGNGKSAVAHWTPAAALQTEDPCATIRPAKAESMHEAAR